MKKTISIILLTLLWSGMVYGQQLPGDSLAGDFKCLVNYLEETHPDPYSGFGGKVFFHKAAFEVGQRLKKGAGREEFATIAMAFMSKLEDGHTWISVPRGMAESELRLPFSARATPDGLMAVVVPEARRELLGSKVVSIGGVPIEELVEKVGQLRPVENVFGACHSLSSAIVMQRLMKLLIPGLGERVTVGLENARGEVVELTLDYLDTEAYAKYPTIKQPKWTAVNESEYMNYHFIDKERRAMLFRMSSIQSREQFLYLQQNSMPNMERMLDMFYTQTFKRERPSNLDEAIAAIPSLAETFRAMLEEMRYAGAPYLIIDLRDNRGGYTPIVRATLYQLYGDRYLETDMGVRFYTMASPLYMQKLGTTLEEINEAQGTSFQYGDYTFDEEEADTRSIEEKRRQFVEQIFGGDTSAIADLNGKPVYTPERVFVITNDGTFSAAFHYAFYLRKMGATVVGVPSSQAPNTFMEVTEFTLPYTGLKGSISNSAQVFLPADDPRAKVFYPDIMLSQDDYRKYGFDKYSDLLYLLEYLSCNF